MRVLIGILCAFAAGMLLAIPMGFNINAKATPLWAIPIALIFIGGIITCAALFFAPGAPHRWQ